MFLYIDVILILIILITTREMLKALIILVNFCTSNKLLFNYLIEKPNSIGIWWSGSSKFTYYSLTKPVKVKKAAGDAPDAGNIFICLC